MINRKRKTPKECLKEGFDLKVTVLTEFVKDRQKFKVSEETYKFKNEIIKPELFNELLSNITYSLKSRLELNEYPDYLKVKIEKNG